MSRSDHPLLSDHRIREAEQQIAQQKALVRRLIVQGTPTQAAEDRLRQLEQTFSRMKEQYRRARAFELQRKMPETRSR